MLLDGQNVMTLSTQQRAYEPLGSSTNDTFEKPTILEQPTIFQDSGKAVSLAPKNRIVSTQNIFLKFSECIGIQAQH